MKDMKRVASDYNTPQEIATAMHLAGLVKTARLARGWSQAELAERARISPATMSRIEKGAVGSTLGAWLSVINRLGLLSLMSNLADPASAAIVDSTKTNRPINTPDTSLDF